MNNWKELINISESFFNAKDYNSAIFFADKAIGLQFFAIQAYYITGLSHYHLKNYGMAIERLLQYLNFEKYDETNRKRFIVTYTLAQCYYSSSNYVEAKDWFIECSKRYKFPLDDKNTLLQQSAQQFLLNSEIKIDEMLSTKNNLLLDYGLNEILTDADDPKFWNRIFLKYLPNTKDIANDLHNNFATLKFSIYNQNKSTRAEWFIEPVTPSQIKPVKNLSNLINKKLILLSISRPSNYVDIASSGYQIYFDGRLSHSVSSDWHKDKNGIWREEEASIDEIWFD